MNKPVPIAIGLILTIITLWLLLTSQPYVHQLITRLDNLSYDLQLQARVFAHRSQPGPITIVDIDDKSLAKEGQWPWPRSKLANLVDKVNSMGVTSISFDIFFSEPQPNIAKQLLAKIANGLGSSCATSIQSYQSVFDEDAVFASSISKGRVILANVFLDTNQHENSLPSALATLTNKQAKDLELINAAGYIDSIAVLQQAATGVGFINVEPDSDGIARRAILVMRYQDKIYPALSIQTLLSMFPNPFSLITAFYSNLLKLEGIGIGDMKITTSEHGQVLIPFIGKGRTFPYISATDVLHDNIPSDALQGRMVIIGTSAIGLGDYHSTPVDKSFPGVEIQATILNGLLKNKFFAVPAWLLGANFSFIILFGLFGTFVFPYLGPRLLTLIIVFLPGILFLFNNWIWIKTGFIFSSLLPVILIVSIAFINIIYGYLFETRKREHLKAIFGQYVPKKHIDEMIKSKGKFTIEGETREMTVLFADIRNFTAISEKVTVKDLVRMLNSYFTPMTEVIFKYKGTIDKYIGDMLMAFWGAPLKDRRHAQHAVDSALEMQARIKAMNEMPEMNNWPAIKIGIGINSGNMAVGDMGSRYRLNYTVLGDAVNVASRIESLTKFYGVEILITEDTQLQINNIIYRKIDKVKVRGRDTGIMLYEVLGKMEEMTPELDKELAMYEKGLIYYFEKKWDDALQIMSALHTSHPDKKLYSLFIKRINFYKISNLPDDWDGTYEHVSK